MHRKIVGKESLQNNGSQNLEKIINKDVMTQEHLINITCCVSVGRTLLIYKENSVVDGQLRTRFSTLS